jgi:hypothetical protein
MIGHLPVTLRPKAETLLRRLKARPDVISWDESGQVKMDGKEIPDSNISDLVSDAMRARKNFNPKGATKTTATNITKCKSRKISPWFTQKTGGETKTMASLLKNVVTVCMY